MDVPKKEREGANHTGMVVRKKLLEIMDLQAGMDALLRRRPRSQIAQQSDDDARVMSIRQCPSWETAKAHPPAVSLPRTSNPCAVGR